MARKPKSVTDIDREIEALKEQRKNALEHRAEQIGKLAARAGLHLLEIEDAELLKELQAVEVRFRGRASSQHTANA